jgi:PAS domain S-box-containing protein
MPANSEGSPEAARPAFSDTSQLVQALDAVDQAVAIVGHDGRIAYVNGACRLLYGYHDRELVGQPFGILCADAQQLPMSALEPPDLNGVHRREDGSTFPAEVQVRRLEAPGFPRFVALITDSTERSQLEAQLLEAQKVGAVGRLSRGLSHDFNNLLTAIVGYVELASRTLGPENDAQRYLGEIRSATEGAARLTRQMLSFSRGLPVAPTATNLGGLVAELEGVLRRLAGEAIGLVIVPGSDVCRVLIDPGQAEQVLANLTMNACDAMPEGGKLTIKTDEVTLGPEQMDGHPGVEAGKFVVLTAADTGVGMSEEVMARVFEPFFTTRGPEGGTGLGLSTCYVIVAEAGGFITVDSKLGSGATFRVYLPRVEEASGPSSGRDNRQRLPAGTEAVLLVDDES